MVNMFASLTLTCLLLLFALNINVIFSDCPGGCGVDEACSSDSQCYGLLDNIKKTNITQNVDEQDPTILNIGFTESELFDNNPSTFGGTTFDADDLWNINVYFNNEDFLHVVKINHTCSASNSMNIYDISSGTTKLSRGPDLDLSFGSYYLYILNSSTMMPRVLSAIQIRFVCSTSVKVYDILLFGRNHTLSPTQQPTQHPSGATTQPSAAPSMPPSLSPSTAPTKYPTPDVCAEFWVEQPCCADEDDYSITHRTHLKYPDKSYLACVERSTDDCCGDDLTRMIASFSGGSVPDEYGCDTFNSDMCNSSYYGNDTVGTILNISLDNSDYVANCECTLYTDYCIGRDYVNCSDSSMSGCSQDTFIGSVSSVMSVQQDLDYDSCSCDYFIKVCNNSEIDSCRDDSCCTHQVDSCCGTADSLEIVMDANGYPVEDWQCGSSSEVCPDLFGGDRFYNASHHVEWWNETEPVTNASVFNYFCQCLYEVNTCVFPPTSPPSKAPTSAMPTRTPSRSPTKSPTTPDPTPFPTEILPAAAETWYIEYMLYIIIGGGVLLLCCVGILIFCSCKRSRGSETENPAKQTRFST